ncbi:MAG: BlaI/MecI/CopY family transcriptional regulator [Saprospiraceae bacterium]|nr:BlaI/MecI/CopY family transcriptional regulator [Saprospiraceae bacterium]
MSSHASKPTDAELEILQVLWQKGSCTVREVNEQIRQSKPDVGYTTTLKLMQIMTEKELVRRDTTHRQHIYEAIIEETLVQEGMVRNIIDRFFQGSAKDLIMHALGQEATSHEELSEIKRLINKIEKEQK